MKSSLMFCTLSCLLAFSCFSLGCSVPVAHEGFSQDSAGVVTSGPLAPPALALAKVSVTRDACASYQGAWALYALNCPAGMSATAGECHVYGSQAALLASGLQGPNAWGCQASNLAGSFSVCVSVTCE